MLHVLIDLLWLTLICEIYYIVLIALCFDASCADPFVVACLLIRVGLAEILRLIFDWADWWEGAFRKNRVQR